MYGTIRNSILGLFCVVLFVSLTSASASAQEHKFGSIYFSQKSGSHGFSYNYDSQKGAEDRASKECRANGASDCVQATWFRNACGALAVGDGNGWGSHWGNDRDDAEFNALSTCQKYAKNCRIVRWVCTAR